MADGMVLQYVKRIGRSETWGIQELSSKGLRELEGIYFQGRKELGFNPSSPSACCPSTSFVFERQSSIVRHAHFTSSFGVLHFDPPILDLQRAVLQASSLLAGLVGSSKSKLFVEPVSLARRSKRPEGVRRQYEAAELFPCISDTEDM